MKNIEQSSGNSINKNRMTRLLVRFYKDEGEASAAIEKFLQSNPLATQDQVFQALSHRKGRLYHNSDLNKHQGKLKDGSFPVVRKATSRRSNWENRLNIAQGKKR